MEFGYELLHRRRTVGHGRGLFFTRCPQADSTTSHTPILIACHSPVVKGLDTGNEQGGIWDDEDKPLLECCLAYLPVREKTGGYVASGLP